MSISALIYNYVTHTAIPVTDTNGIILDPNRKEYSTSKQSNESIMVVCTIDCN